MPAFVPPTPALSSRTRTPRAVSSARSTFVSTRSHSVSPRFSRRSVLVTRVSPRANMSEVESGIRTELTNLFKEKPCMPIMVRLAWHDAGTYNVKDGSGGANASIRFDPEKGHGANNGLNIAMEFLEPIKAKFAEVSYADLYQLASVHAIEFAGGPKIPFRFGRRDAAEADCTPDGRLPDATKRMGHLRDVFYRMGLDDKDITVLSGAHTLGRAHEERSGFEGPWTKVPVKFDNTYFVEILKEEPDPDLLRLSSDLALLDEPETRALCEKYAKDQQAFFDDYVESHKKLSELGCFVQVA